MDAHCEAILKQYDNNIEAYKLIEDIVYRELKRILDEQGMLISSIDHRIKERKSLEGKLERKGQKYNSIEDITDIFGIRVVTFYTEEVDKIATYVEKLFDIDWENSIDKRGLLDIDEFGYMSVHYICRIPASLYTDGEHPLINKLRFEIQIRTALQHVWSTVEHDIGYKSNVEIPKQYLRALNRLAGLLEIADEEFSSIANEIADYRRKVEALVKDGDFNNLELNGDTFRDYMNTDPFIRLNERIASINHAEIMPQNPSQYLIVLNKLGFTNLGQIEEMKKEFAEDAFRLAIRRLAETDLDILSSNIGLLNVLCVYLLKNEFGLPSLINVLDTVNGKSERNKHNAERIISDARALNII